MDLYDEQLEWSQGVITSLEPDAIPKNALARADNAMFTSMGGGVAQVRKRQGMTLVNSTPLRNTSAVAGPAINAGGVYTYRNAGTATRYIALAQADGAISLLLDDGSTTAHAATATFASALTANYATAALVEMNNRLFALDSEGAKASLLNTTSVGWGVSPTAIDSAAAGAAGAMTGAYDLLVTVYDSRISEESDRSAIVSITGLSSETIDLDIDAVDAGLTHLYARVYLRKPSLGSGFFRVNAGTGYDATHGGFPLASASPTIATNIDISDATLTEILILTPPPINARGLPPADAKYAVVKGRRLFLLSDNTLYWSELDKPDAFNPLSAEPIKFPRGGVAVGLSLGPPAPDGTVAQLYIWGETGRLTLTGGDDQQSWEFDVASPSIGTTGPHAMTEYRGSTFFWNPERGPVELRPDGTYSYIGADRIRPDVARNIPSKTNAHRIHVVADDGRVWFAIPEAGQSLLTRIYPYHADLGAWESTRWDPMRAGCVVVAEDTAETTHVYSANGNGQLFRVLDGNIDGVRAGTTEGTFVAGSASLSSISDAAAAFDITGAGLKERKLAVLDSAGMLITLVRPTITANTATGLTLDVAITGLEVGETYTYLVGGPNLWLETRWEHHQLPFVKKRFDNLFIQLRADSGTARVNLSTAFSWDALNSVAGAIDDIANELWDEAFWDIATWDTTSVITKRLRLLKNGLNYRVRILNAYPNQGLTLLKIGQLARRLDARYTDGR